MSAADLSLPALLAWLRELSAERMQSAAQYTAPGAPQFFRDEAYKFDAIAERLTTLDEQAQSWQEELRRQMAMKNDYLKAADTWSERAEHAEAQRAGLLAACKFVYQSMQATRAWTNPDRNQEMIVLDDAIVIAAVDARSACAHRGPRRGPDHERCEGRYPVPQTSPPRDEPFGVTYRCGRQAGHDGPHGDEARTLATTLLNGIAVERTHDAWTPPEAEGP